MRPTNGVSNEPPHLSKSLQHEMLRRMLRIRMFEEMAVTQVQAKNIPGMIHNCIGQEAEIVGACMTLRDDDYLTGNHRSHGHPIAKGAALSGLMAELFGKSTGICHGKGGSMHLAAFAVGSLGESGIVGAAMPAAAGAGLSARLRKTDQVCLCFFGDGAANCGPFHESLNLAAVWNLPVIFLCENNGYATCSMQSMTTSVSDIAVRSASYEIPGVIVDGQDVMAVHAIVSTAVARARAGHGPTLVEAKTYRFCDHLEGFKYPTYRPDAELHTWRGRDPIEAFSKWLTTSEQMTEAEIGQLRSEIELEVESATEFALQSPQPHPTELFSDLFV